MLNSQSSKKWSHNIWTFSDLVTISHKVCGTEMQKPHLVLHLQELVPRQRWPPGPAPGRQRHYGGSSGGSSGHRRGWRHLHACTLETGAMITTNSVQDIWFFNCQSIPIQWQCVDTSEAFIWVIALNFSDWFAFPVRCVTKIPTSRIDTGKGGGHNHWGQLTSSSSERRSSPDLALDSVCSSVVEPARLTDLDRIANFSSSSSGNIWSRLISSSSSSKTSIWN